MKKRLVVVVFTFVLIVFAPYLIGLSFAEKLLCLVFHFEPLRGIFGLWAVGFLFLTTTFGVIALVHRIVYYIKDGD